MNVTFACPKCERANRAATDGDAPLRCDHCGRAFQIPAGAYEDGRLRRCLVCPSTDLYVRKDFPQRLGVALVAVGIVGSSIAWYYTNVFWTFGILFGTALADFLLYLAVGDALMCYRCGAQYRQLATVEEHAAFDLETHERYRQLDARLKENRRKAEQVPGGGPPRDKTTV